MKLWPVPLVKAEKELLVFVFLFRVLIPHRHLDARLVFEQIGAPGEPGIPAEVAENSKRGAIDADGEPVLQKACLLVGVTINGRPGFKRYYGSDRLRGLKRGYEGDTRLGPAGC